MTVAPGINVTLDIDWAVPTPDWAPADETMRGWVVAVLAAAAAPELRHRALEISLLVTDASAMQALNLQYRQQNKATNVLSFPEQTPIEDDRLLLGDLVICLPVVVKEAAAQGKDPLVHLTHLVLHGALHLLGHDHVDPVEAAQMEALEVSLLAAMGHADPYTGEPVAGRVERLSS